MGNTLNKPITTKTTVKGETNNEIKGVRWGVSSMQGWRIHMEDYHIAEVIREVQDPDSGDLIKLDETHYFFAVLDGHGGAMAAKYASEHLFPMLSRRPEFVKYARQVGQVTKELPVLQSDNQSQKNQKFQERTFKKSSSIPKLEDSEKAMLLQQALEDSFVELDLQLLKEMVNQRLFHLVSDPANKIPSEDKQVTGEGDWGVELVDPEMETTPRAPEIESGASGTTVTAVLVTPEMIICANAGDSRTIIDAFPLSTDHKPSLPQERQRIIDAMGMVNFNRVDGELAVSRALGDFEFKAYNQSHIVADESIDLDMDSKRNLARTLKVSPFPEVTVHHRTDIDQAIILACDGIWDVMSNIECNELVQVLCEQGESDVGLIAEEILDTCLKKGSRDNMTVLVGLLPAQEIGNGGGVLKRRRGRMRKLSNFR